MENIQIIILILIIHFLADFGLQTHEQATKKGESNKFLFYHVAVYTLVWAVAYWILPVKHNISEWVGFSMYIGMSHYFTDYITARIGKPFWKKGDYHNGFVVVGFDQLVHYLFLIHAFILLGLL